MVFNEDGGDMDEIAVARRESRIVWPGGDALTQVTLVGGKNEGTGNVAGGLEVGIQRGPQSAVEPDADPRRPGERAVPTVEAVGDVVLVINAVGDMHVEIEGGLGLLDEQEHGAHLRRLGFHVVTVQIQVLRRGPPALVDGPR